MQGQETQDQRYTRVAKQFAPAIERLARGYEADPELRRDLVQEVHVALWRSFAYFADGCSERSWTYRIAHNVAVTHMIRRRRVAVETLLDLSELATLASGVETDLEMEQRTDHEWLLSVIHRLKAIDRQVMILHLEGLSAAEIAEVVGLTPGSVAVRVHRTKAFLSRTHMEAIL